MLKKSLWQASQGALLLHQNTHEIQEFSKPPKHQQICFCTNQEEVAGDGNCERHSTVSAGWENPHLLYGHQGSRKSATEKQLPDEIESVIGSNRNSKLQNHPDHEQRGSDTTPAPGGEPVAVIDPHRAMDSRC